MGGCFWPDWVFFFLGLGLNHTKSSVEVLIAIMQVFK